MTLEERVADMIQTKGSLAFMDAIIEYDSQENRYGAWLLTLGFIDTFKIVKGVPTDDKTF